MNVVQTKAAIASLEALLIALKGSVSPVKPVRAATRKPFRASRSNVSAQTDRILRRNAAIARGFAAKGIRVTFDAASGRFSNVKPYRLWLADGRQVKRGQASVRGFFHITQTEPLAA